MDNLQPTIDRTVERQGNVLEKRLNVVTQIRYQSLFSALERANNNLVKYRQSLDDLKNSIDKSDLMQLTLMEVQNYKSYSNTLIKEVDRLEGEVCD
jgi:predicted component of type VI protein secretion system